MKILFRYSYLGISDEKKIFIKYYFTRRQRENLLANFSLAFGDFVYTPVLSVYERILARSHSIKNLFLLLELERTFNSLFSREPLPRFRKDPLGRSRPRREPPLFAVRNSKIFGMKLPSQHLQIETLFPSYLHFEYIL